MRFLNYLNLVLSLLFIFSTVGAGALGCTFEIPLGQRNVDGITMGVKPGDTICLQGGNRAELAFKNLSGTKDHPIIIINKEEKVVIHTDEGKAIFFENSVHFRLTGTGGPDKYGIEIASSGIQGVEVSEFSSDVEIDHLEIHDVGFAGIMAKTDPNCSRKDLRYFTMYNLSFHDNYIYDAGGEGFYVGYSWYPIRETDCNGTPVLYYPHPIHGVRIYHNIIQDTQWDGLQVGSSPVDVKIYGNTITNYGIADELYQNHGVQIGAGTTGDFYNNFINSGTGGGISFFGIGNNRLYNNVIINTGEQAIYHNDKNAVSGSYYQIYNNTIINPKEKGIWLNASTTENNLVANNLIVLDNLSSAIVNSSNHWVNENNLTYQSLEQVKFSDPDDLDFNLSPNSPAIDAGKKVYWLHFDFNNRTRPANEKYDVGAFEYGSEPYIPSSLGAVDGLLEKEFVVYPNPVGDSIYIRSIQELTAGEPEVTMYDGKGRIVLKKIFNVSHGASGFTIESKEIPAGVYYLYLRKNSGRSELFRMVKVK